jgi:hypothetical protein
MSIWTLAIRLGRNSWAPKSLTKISTHTSLVSRLYEIACKNTRNGDAVQLKTTVKQWDTFMALYQYLFGKKDRKYYWSTARLARGSNVRSEGIQKLLTGASTYHELFNQYQKLKKEIKK